MCYGRERGARVEKIFLPNGHISFSAGGECSYCFAASPAPDRTEHHALVHQALDLVQQRLALVLPD